MKVSKETIMLIVFLLFCALISVLTVIFEEKTNYQPKDTAPVELKKEENESH